MFNLLPGLKMIFMSGESGAALTSGTVSISSVMDSVGTVFTNLVNKIVTLADTALQSPIFLICLGVAITFVIVALFKTILGSVRKA